MISTYEEPKSFESIVRKNSPTVMSIVKNMADEIFTKPTMVDSICNDAHHQIVSVIRGLQRETVLGVVNSIYSGDNKAFTADLSKLLLVDDMIDNPTPEQRVLFTAMIHKVVYEILQGDYSKIDSIFDGMK